MIIDAHAHVYAHPRIRYGPDATTFMSAEDQIALMDRQGIDKSVILPLVNPEVIAELQGIDEILGICARYPGRFIPFCNVDPRLIGTAYKTDAAHFEFILSQYKELGCRGLGELAAKLDWDDPRVLALFQACQKLQLPVTFHTSTAGTDDYGLVDEIGFPRFEKVLQRFPDLIFFGHSNGFWSEISGDVTLQDKYRYPTGPVQPNGAVPRLMRNYPQLYGDLSANSGITALARDETFAYEFINEFQDRLLFGQDYCSTNQSLPHLQWLTAARDNGHISPSAYEKIMWKNLSRVLHLDT